MDRTRFLLLAAAMAGCHAAGGRDRPVPVASIIVEPAPQPSTEQEATKPADSTDRCDGIPVRDECPGEDARTFCDRYARNFRKDVADEAIACLRSLPAGERCYRCPLTTCGMAALEAAKGDTDPACAEVESACEGMGGLCEHYSRGLNESGRRRFRTCLADNCGIGVRYCLWDPASTPCSEGAGSRHFEF